MADPKDKQDEVVIDETADERSLDEVGPDTKEEGDELGRESGTATKDQGEAE